jgi:hypothetical protein
LCLDRGRAYHHVDRVHRDVITIPNAAPPDPDPHTADRYAAAPDADPGAADRDTIASDGNLDPDGHTPADADAGPRSL